MNWLEGNRKLLLTLILGIMAGIAVIGKAITWDQCFDFYKWLTGFYVAGNVGEHVAKAMGKKEKTE